MSRTTEEGSGLEELRLSEERHRLALEGSHTALWDWDLVANTLFLSAAWKAQLGYEDHELDNAFETWSSALHPEDRPQVLAQVEAFVADVEAHDWCTTFRLRHKDGTWRWIQARATTLRDAEGRARRMLGTHVDRTAEREAEQALEAEQGKLRALFDGIEEVIYVADPETYELLFVNEAVRGLMGDVLGRSCFEALQGRDSPCPFCTNERIFAEGRRGEAYVWEFRNEVTGRWYRCSDKAIRWADGRWVRLELASDITASKEAEVALECTAAELERSNAELERFAYVASHDLQEPLRMVASYLGLLERRLEPFLDAEAREFMGYAVGGARRMKELLRGLLEYSRVGTRGHEAQSVALDDIVAEVLLILEPRLEESNAEVVVGALPKVLGDASQMLQVLQNLLCNALKFCGEAPPKIEISARREGDSWRIAVQDQGIGIAKDHHAQIFDVFRRLHGSDRYPGTGAGLSIARRIVERHGGSLEVESEEGRGATFSFCLPAAPRSETDANG